MIEWQEQTMIGLGFRENETLSFFSCSHSQIKTTWHKAEAMPSQQFNFHLSVFNRVWSRSQLKTVIPTVCSRSSNCTKRIWHHWLLVPLQIIDSISWNSCTQVLFILLRFSLAGTNHHTEDGSPMTVNFYWLKSIRDAIVLLIILRFASGSSLSAQIT